MSSLRRYINAGAVFAWPLNGGAPLQEARNRHAVTGAPGVVNSPYGLALSFDGAADYVTLGAAWEDQLRFDGGTLDFSVVAWVRRTAWGALSTIVDKRDAADDGWTLFFQGTEEIACSIDAIDITGATAVLDGRWHCVSVTVDRSGNGQLYLDGVADGGAVAIGGEVMATTTAPRIGAQSFDAANKFTGEIAGVFVIPRILTAAECLQIATGSAF